MGVPLHAPNLNTGDSLTYNTEAMIPVEVGKPSLRRQLFNLSLNQENHSVGHDLMNKLRDKSKICEIACKLRAARRYNTKVRSRSFKKGNLIWRIQSEARKTNNKVSSNWENPFQIRDVAAEGHRMPRTSSFTTVKY